MSVDLDFLLQNYFRFPNISRHLSNFSISSCSNSASTHPVKNSVPKHFAHKTKVKNKKPKMNDNASSYQWDRIPIDCCIGWNSNMDETKITRWTACRRLHLECLDHSNFMYFFCPVSIFCFNTFDDVVLLHTSSQRVNVMKRLNIVNHRKLSKMFFF